jgi:hypothetical protein
VSAGVPNNVIEVVVRTIDEATAPARDIVKGFESIGAAVKEGIGGAVVVEAFHKFIENTLEAEQAQARLQIAVNNSIEGAIAGAKALEEFSSTFGKSSIFSSSDLDNAQAALLRFDRVYGDVFDRARVDAINLAAAVGGDVTSAATSLGRALESPTFGMRALAAEGVTFTTQQRAMITELDRTGQSLKAQQIILGAVEDATKGAGDAISETLGGAFKRLSNSIADFAKSDDPKVAASAINDLATAVNNLNDASKKNGESPLSRLATLFLPGADLIQKGAVGLGNAGSFFGSALGQPNIGGIPFTPFTPTSSSNSSGASGYGYDTFLKILEQANADAAAAADAARKAFPEFHITNTSVVSDKIKDFNEKLLKSIDTATEKTVDDYYEQLAKILIAENTKGGPGLITPDEADKKRQELLDNILPEFNTPNAQAANNARVLAGGQRVPLVDLVGLQKKELVPVADEEKQLFEVIDTVSKGLTNLFEQGGVTARSITQVFVKAFEDKAIVNAMNSLVDFIKTSILNAFSANAGGASTSGSAASSGIGAIAAAIFGKAGGGDYSGLRIVGENGPELVEGSGHVYNQQQLAFMGASGGAPAFAPHTEINFNAPVGSSSSDQKKVLAMFRAEIADNNRQQFNAWQTLMWNNGFGRLRT